MFPGVVISAVLMIWMLSSGSSGKSSGNKSEGKGDGPAKIVAGNGDYIIIQQASKKS